MRILKMTAAVCAVLVLVFSAAGTSAQALHPHYLDALSDLRTARDFIQADQRPGIGDVKHHAVDEINKAIAEIKHAAWDDGKNTKYAPTHGGGEPWMLLRQARDWLNNAHNAVVEGSDRPENQGYRDEALRHIAEAAKTLSSVIPPR